jgi:hypothetical protein
MALEMYALTTGQFNAEEARLTYDAAFPASLWNGLGDRRFEILDELTAALSELRQLWVDHDA